MWNAKRKTMNNGSFSPSEVRIDVEREPRTTHYKRTFSHRSNHDEGATLVFKNVCVTLNKQDILKNVSGLAKVGHMLAIMGPSGAGKSTLLNTLTGRTHARSGSITFNGQPINRHMRRKVSYVQQQDVFYPNLTLKETMTFAALLRLPDRMPHDKKMQRMHEIIDALELKKCLNTKIGGTFITGLSGGERKRVSIACELLTNPKIIILDEPTSGLDSAIAYSLMSIMDKYSRQSHKTVVTTIHQPASQIFHMFANILLLTDGQVAYFGREDKIIGFFAGLGLHCDPLYNPADFILEQVKADPETVKRILEGSAILRTQEDWPAELRDGNYDKQSKALPSSTNAFENAAFTNHADDYQHTENVEKTPVHVQLQEVDVDSYIDEDATWQTGFLTQYKILTWRAFVHAKDRFLSPLNLIQLLIAILAGLEWWQLARTEETASDRLGILFFLIVHFGFVPITEAVFHIFDSDGVFIKERSAGIYRLSAYYLSIMTSEFPMTFVQVTIFLNCVYWMTGLMADAYNFFLFYLTLLLSAYTAQSFGFFTGVVIRNGSFIIPVANTIMIISLLTGGFYNAHIAWWFVWMKYLSFISYVLGALSKIEFEYGAPLKCNYPNMTMYPEYCSSNNTNGFVPGEEFLKANSLDFLPFWAYFAVLAAVIIVFRILTYIVLRFFRRPTA